MTDRTALQATPADELELSPMWQRSLDAYASELATRGCSPATVRAYRRDLLELADWATTQHREPGELVYRDLRRYAATLSERRLARTTIARKLAATRSFHTHLVTTGVAESNPADLLPATKKGSRLPRVLGRDEVADMLDRIPARTPLEIRDRALFELAYSSGLRAEEIVTLDLDGLDFESEIARVTGQGLQDPARADGRAGPGGPAPVSRCRPPRARTGPRRAGAVRLAPRAPPLGIGRSPPAEQVGA